MADLAVARREWARLVGFDVVEGPWRCSIEGWWEMVGEGPEDTEVWE